MQVIDPHENMFKVIGDYSDAEALNLSIRSDLMLKLREFIQGKRMTQTQAAAFFGTNQPRISQLVNGHIDKFSVDMLLSMLSKTGVTATIHFTEKEAA